MEISGKGISCLVNMNKTRVWRECIIRLLKIAYPPVQDRTVNRWITWSQFTCHFKGVNETMTQAAGYKQIDYLVTAHMTG